MNASGTQPFDYVYDLGYQVNHLDWSPFPRVNHLRQTFLDRPYEIDLERLKLVTSSYKKHESQPRKLQCAYAFKNILENTTIYIYDQDLILGEIAAPAKASPIYPEFSVDWIIDEILHSPFEERANDQFFIRNDSDRKEIVKLCKYWQDKTVDHFVRNKLDPSQTIGSQTGDKIFQTNVYQYAGIGHLAMDYDMLMKEGYDGLINKTERSYLNLSKKDPDYSNKQEFYQSVLIMLKASKKYIQRYADLAKSESLKISDEVRKAELEQLSANCYEIAGGVPKTFWQALQLFNFATTMTQIESNGHSISYGRMDQWLYPFYKSDIESGNLTKEFALELLEVLFVKMNNPTKLKDKGTVLVRNGRGFGGESLTIGGVDKHGQDITNDLTMLVLEASAHTRMMNPWVCVRMHENTPYELKVKAVECIRAGYGHPKLFNDEPTIKAMIRKGMSLDEARNYAVVGCVEPSLPGKEFGWHDAAYINTAKMLELVWNAGQCIDGGVFHKPIAPNTGSLETYKNFDEVLESVKKQLNYWCDQICSTLNIIDNAHRECKPTPYVSAFFEDCILSGKDLSEGGAKYNGTGPQASGIATCADSLSTVKQLVFDEKKYTGAQLLQALKDNWHGHEKLYALVNSSKVHHYGNDDDYADNLFKFMFEEYCNHINTRENPRGGKYSPGVYSVNANVGMGMFTNASLDGRFKGEAISDNMGPVHTDGGSHDINGPTALANSVAKVDHSLASNGTLLNLRFPQEAVSGKTGRDNLVYFIEEYMSMNPMHVQFNIMDAKTMRAAQKNPENYKDMLVRVAGYSAYFVELGKPLQKDLIQRTELHF